jgi:hypothetical protein
VRGVVYRDPGVPGVQAPFRAPPLSNEGARTMRRLTSCFPGLRSEAVNEIARTTDGALVAAVFEAFLRGDKREMAAEALWRLTRRPTPGQTNRRELFLEVARRRGPAITPRLLERLDDGDGRAQEVALIGLEALAPVEAHDRLFTALQALVSGQGPTIRSYALFRAVAVHRDPRAVPLLEAALERDRTMEDEVLEALGAHGSPEAAAVLLRQVDHTSRSVGARAALATMLEEPAISAQLSASPDGSLRRLVVEHLARRTDADASDRLLVFVDDDDPFVRTAAATALARRKDVRAVSPIARAIVTPTHGWELGELADALALLDDKSALVALRQALQPRRSRSTGERPDLSAFAEGTAEDFERYGDKLERDGVAKVKAAIAQLER